MMTFVENNVDLSKRDGFLTQSLKIQLDKTLRTEAVVKIDAKLQLTVIETLDQSWDVFRRTSKSTQVLRN